MTADYEAEQERLKLEIDVTEEWLETQETMSTDVDADTEVSGCTGIDAHDIQ